MIVYPYTESTALVTGASRGIGAAIAHALAGRGVRALVLTARSKSDLEHLATELFGKHGLRVETIVADLSDPAAPAFIKAETDQRGLTVDLLVNNAGWGTHGVFSDTDAKKSRDMVEVNVQALVELTRLYLPSLIATNRGGVVNIASTASFQPVPFMAVYAATKAFVLSFTEALAVEVTEQGATGVRVVGLCPGGTQTNFGDGMLRGHFENATQDSPEAVASATLAALDKNEPVAIVGAKNYFMAQSARFAPRRVVAEVAGDIFRPTNLPAKNKPRRPVTLLALVLGTIGVVLSAVLVTRRRRG